MKHNKLPYDCSNILTIMTATIPKGVPLSFCSKDGAVVLIKVADKLVKTRWLAVGLPAQVKELLKSAKPDLVVAPHFSQGARELLSQNSIGWMDESGAAEFILGTIVVSRTGIQPPKRPPSRLERWSPSVQAAAEALLCQTIGTVEEIGRVTGLSTGACTKALRELTDSGLLVSDAKRGRYSARRIKDQSKFLDAFAAAVAANSRKRVPEITVGGAWRDLLEGLANTGTRWNEQKIEWATTGAAAAEIVAPLMTTIGSAVVYVAASTLVELEAVAKAAGLQIIEGGRLILKPFPTTTSQTLAKVVDGLRIAPWPRIYADLRTTGVRGEDAAEHLREVINGG